MKKAITVIPAAILLFTFCSKTGIQTQPASVASASRQTMATATSATAQTKGTSGSKSSIPAYYDSMLATIHFVEFAPMAEANLIAHNGSLNIIYQSAMK